MSFFKRIISNLIDGNDDTYQRKLNFISACCELGENYGYEIIYISRYQEPQRVGNVKFIDVWDVELEVCKKLNYRVIVLESYYLKPPPMTKLINDGIVSYEYMKDLFITDISPTFLDRGSFGEYKNLSSFDFLEKIESKRKSLESSQTNSSDDFSKIYNHISNFGIPYIQSLVTSHDKRTFF